MVARHMPAPDDLGELLSRTAQGDEVGFASLYDATHRSAFGLALRILRDREAAEEATLEAYATVWRRASQYDPDKGRPMTWILTVTRSKAIDLLRARMRRQEREQPLGTDAGLEDPEPGPDAMCDRSEQVHRMKNALAALPTEQRQAIETAYFAGLSHSEVATALGQPLGTVKTRIRTALSTLRRTLAEAQ